MNRVLLILLSACVLAAAMAPHDTREVDEKVEICSEKTPCGWQVYNSHTKIVSETLDNTYCKCPDDKPCQFSEDDLTTHVYVLRCKKPSYDDKDESEDRS